MHGVRDHAAVVRLISCFGLAATAESVGPDTVRGVLGETLLGDAEPRVRTAAAAALGQVGGTAAPASLVAATDDSDVRVRRSAVKALGMFDDPAAVGALAARADDPDRETALRAAESLLALEERPAAGSAARARVETSDSWSIDYAQAVAGVAA